MQLIRTLLLLLVTIALVAFIAINWQTVPLNLWPLQDGNYVHLEWPVGFIVIISMALGFLPMWLLHKGARWRLTRRISFLENSVKSASQSAPIATSTQLEAATPEAPPPLP
ncbi:MULTISPECIES: LapA family protein [unclassified Novosphingobium]|uniref:LapA family protein n=1 Tax=unclassified Novosphingobium TaxID=2644732 RepID=UPI0025EAF374|nr:MULTISPECIES: LapA family protein [unclassified Novosphingobium]HQV03707.1 LapA family protein [Novosphingobium sp.]